jgi:hypothetical protein
MPAVTYLHQHEALAWRTVPDDKDCDELLQEVRKITGDEWVIQVTTHQTKKTLWRPSREVKFYTLYFGMPNGVEWQVVNLITPGSDSGSVFSPSEFSRELTMNFLMGMRNGYEGCRERMAAEEGRAV